MEISDDIIRADVIGSEDYEVEISLSNGEVTDMLGPGMIQYIK